MDETKSQNLENFQRRGFELCLAIYRVTRLFPEKEVLIGQLREVSARIIILLAHEQIRDTILKVEELKIYLGVAREQNWLKPINFDLLKNAYEALREALTSQFKMDEEKDKGGVKKEVIINPPLISKKEPDSDFIFLDAINRQKKIIDYFQKNKQARAADLLNIAGNVSGRTIRNDLAELIKKGLIRKMGNNRTTYYILNE